MSKTKQISVFGTGQCEPGSVLYREALYVGELIRRHGGTVATGAYGGVMEAAAKGATDSGGVAIGFTMKGHPGNSYLTEEVDCQELARDVRIVIPHLDFLVRLGNLMKSEGFVIIAQGRVGTATELIATMLFNEKLWPRKRPVAILNPPGLECHGWDTDMLQTVFSFWGVRRQTREMYKIYRKAGRAVNHAFSFIE